MKRSQLKRRSYVKRDEPGRDEWKVSRAGWCACGCDRFSMHLHRHHVVLEQHVRAEGGDPWDLANSMLLHEHCHMAHHAARRRIPLPNVPDAAVAFAVALFGDDLRAAQYLRRFYLAELPEVA